MARCMPVCIHAVDWGDSHHAHASRRIHHWCSRAHQRVRHGQFGEGTVVDSEGAGAHARVQVNFEDSGSKWLVMAYANLQVL